MAMEFNYLESFLIERTMQEQASQEVLPLYHTCSLLDARDYIRLRKLFPKHCDVFTEKLIYLFLGRAEYRDHQATELICHRPIGFVINPLKLPKLKRIYPFDTGAIVEEKYGEIFSKDQIDEVKSKYCLGSDLHYAYSLINIIYGNPLNYVNQSALDDKEIKYDLEVEWEMDSIKKIHKLRYKKPDSRKATIEVQVWEDIPFTAEMLTEILTPGIAISKYEKLKELINDLDITLKIKPDCDSAMENGLNTQDCFTQIRLESINLSRSKCVEN